MCAFSLVISSIFGKKFPFPFPYFVLRCLGLKGAFVHSTSLLRAQNILTFYFICVFYCITALFTVSWKFSLCVQNVKIYMKKPLGKGKYKSTDNIRIGIKREQFLLMNSKEDSWQITDTFKNENTNSTHFLSS